MTNMIKSTPIEIMNAIGQLDGHIYKTKLSLEMNSNSLSSDYPHLLNELENKYNSDKAIDVDEIESISRKADEIRTMSDEIKKKIDAFIDYLGKASDVDD